MKAAAAAQEFEQAALERNRLRAVRSLLERQRVANESVGTLDIVAVAVARDRRQRPGLPGPRRRALRPPVLLPRERGRAGDRRGRARVHAPVLRRRRCRSRRRSSCSRRSRRTSAVLAEMLGERRGVAGRGARRRARRQAPHPRARRAQRASSRSTRRSSRPSAAASSASRRSTASRRRSGSTRCRCGSSASTSRT